MNLIGTNNIYTTRLLLRKFTLDDAQSMFDNYCHDEAVCKFLTWNPHKDINDTKEILSNYFTKYNNETYKWAITLLSEPEKGVIGSIDFTKLDIESCTAEVGYCLSRAYWNKSIMTEAFKSIINYFFNELKGLRLEACFELGNNASEKVMIKCGLKKSCGTETNYLPLKNKNVVVQYYYIDKTTFINNTY